MDEQFKQAFAVLGLKEGASREEVNKRYDLLIRQSRSRGRTPDGKSEFEEINRAYKYIVESENAALIDQKREERYAKWGRFAGAAEKTDDFFRLHKVKVFLSLIAVILIVAAAVTYANHRQEQNRLAKLPPVDLSLMYIGDFMLPDDGKANEALEKAMLTPFPDWKRLDIKVTYLPADISSAGQMAVALQQKAQLEVMTENPDLYILDKSSFEWLSQGGALENLDDLANGELKALLPAGTALTATSQDDASSHVYGIDLSGSSLAANLPIGKTGMVVAVRNETKLTDKALQFIQAYLQAEAK